MMQDAAQPRRPTLLPLVRYRDPEAAIAWLNNALGFETRRRATGGDGKFAYAHLAFGESLIMVTRDPKADCERRSKLPAVGRLATPRCYFVVDDIEVHLRRAKEAGADIVRGIKNYEHGGRHYTCRDPEGHMWTFGTYDPWQATLPVPVSPRPAGMRSPLARRSAVAAAALAVIALSVSIWQLWQTQPVATDSAQVSDNAAQLQAENAGESLELQRTREALAEAQAVRAAAEAAQSQTAAELAQERSARQEAQRSADALAASLATAEATQGQVREELAQERAARQEAQRSADAIAAELTAARATRDAAEKLSRDLDERGRNKADATQPTAGPAPTVQLTAIPAPAQAAPTSAQASNPALAEAHAALASGDVATARRLLKELADQGNAEAALALGSTYDPINIARTGLANAVADRAQAKQWYRRALELARAVGERHEEK